MNAMSTMSANAIFLILLSILFGVTLVMGLTYLLTHKDVERLKRELDALDKLHEEDENNNPSTTQGNDNVESH